MTSFMGVQAMQNKTGKQAKKKPDNYNDPFPKTLRDLLGMEDGSKTRDGAQTRLAKHLGIKPQNISFYAWGNNKPSVDVLCKMADYLGVSTDYLLGRTMVRSPDPDIRSAVEYTGLSEEAINILHDLHEQLEKTKVTISYKPFEINEGLSASGVVLNAKVLKNADEYMREIAEMESVISFLNTLICSEVIYEISFYLNSGVLAGENEKHLNEMVEMVTGANHLLELGRQQFCSNKIQELAKDISESGKKKLFPYLSDFEERYKKASDEYLIESIEKHNRKPRSEEEK